MCLAMPAQILDVDNYSAIIDIMGLESKINIQLIEDLKVGDYVLVHAGCAIQKIDKYYFQELYRIFQSILDSEEKDD
ncbi:HypC/HybG/HupF family hydrogenase formation chaperone [Clostridium beijerinckii]|jgi:hydrogenase expression/formation protein HypC|uniref:Hydrogenase assembly protein HypC n=1 Tax=Clostridium beijerinckii TaxID=1520 RepID=A0A1S9N9R0_CLOBE|nr:HypC/HybG/HupF family hydrogenase formation chaperone [Clostridium beijerinckii]MDK2828355.1 hydrogenase expression/formation protein HypC [Clostridium butyricum]OOP74284.1 hydrogenase assembly protein HypC [Clostridium beijerinckii]